MKSVDFDELVKLAKPIQDYINNNFHPNMTVIITPESFKICEDIAFTNT